MRNRLIVLGAERISTRYVEKREKTMWGSRCLGAVTLPLPTMVHDDVWCRFPLVLAYFPETHYMTPLQKVLLLLRRMWALTLSLAFVTDVLKVVRKIDYRIIPLDWLPQWATSVLRGKLEVILWHHYVGHTETAPSMFDRPREYRWWVDRNP